MKCCKCNKNINMDSKSIPPTWFGLYKSNTLIRVICDECIKSAKNKDWWCIENGK
jgi:hypothetical protein